MASSSRSRSNAGFGPFGTINQSEIDNPDPAFGVVDLIEGALEIFPHWLKTATRGYSCHLRRFARLPPRLEAADFVIDDFAICLEGAHCRNLAGQSEFFPAGPDLVVDALA